MIPNKVVYQMKRLSEIIECNRNLVEDTNTTFTIRLVPFVDKAPLGAVQSAGTMRIELADSSMVSCQKGPTHHAYAWQIGPFWRDTLDMGVCVIVCVNANSAWCT